MAATAERQMNLAALQQRDPYITAIVDTASQVALYCFNSKNNEWEKTSVEGTLFVYSRSSPPINGFMILNRLGLNDLIEPINKNLEFQLQDPFLLYRNEKASIYGIWFYDKDECARIGQLMNSLVQICIGTPDSRDPSSRQRRASESDTMVDRGLLGAMATDGPPSASGKRGSQGVRGNVDILQMLSKALDEYESKPGTGPVIPKTEPKPLIDNPNASATKSSDLIKPLAMKVTTAQGASAGDIGGGAAACGATAGASGGPDPAPGTVPGTANVNTLEKLFRQASIQQEPQLQAPQLQAPTLQGPQLQGPQLQGPQLQALQPQPASVPAPGAPPTGNHGNMAPTGNHGNMAPTGNHGNMPPLLQRLMSNPCNTVAEIERQQREEFPRDQMPKPTGEEAPPGGINGGLGLPPALRATSAREPDSPNTALKRSLNILPPVAPRESTSPATMPFDQSRLRTSQHPPMAAQFASYAPTSGVNVQSRSLSQTMTSLTTAAAPVTKVTPPPTTGQVLPTGPMGLPHSFSSTPQPSMSLGTGLTTQGAGYMPGLSQGTGLGHGQVLCSSPGLGAAVVMTQGPPVPGQGPPMAQGPPLRQGPVMSHPLAQPSPSHPLAQPSPIHPLAQPSPLGVPQPPSLGQASLGAHAGSRDPEELITPQALMQQCASTAGITQPGPSGSQGSVLLSPMVFQTSRVTPPVSQLHHSESTKSLSPQDPSPQCSDFSVVTAGRAPSPLLASSPPAITPLTVTQLQQAMGYLIKHDPQFLTTLHEAYVKSLNLGLSSHRNGNNDRS